MRVAHDERHNYRYVYATIAIFCLFRSQRHRLAAYKQHCASTQKERASERANGVLWPPRLRKPAEPERATTALQRGREALLRERARAAALSGLLCAVMI